MPASDDAGRRTDEEIYAAAEAEHKAGVEKARRLRANWPGVGYVPMSVAQIAKRELRERDKAREEAEAEEKRALELRVLELQHQALERAAVGGQTLVGEPRGPKRDPVPHKGLETAVRLLHEGKSIRSVHLLTGISRPKVTKIKKLTALGLFTWEQDRLVIRREIRATSNGYILPTPAEAASLLDLR